ncbi:MAG: 30S ribosomal protein S17 [Candidatus Firestonebacteria bacterium]
MDKRGARKIRTGIVVSNKMDKTVVVNIERVMTHPLYKKILKKTKRFKVHDEKNECKIGDVVKIMETKPISKEKCWRVVAIVEKGKLMEVVPV